MLFATQTATANEASFDFFSTAAQVIPLLFVALAFEMRVLFQMSANDSASLIDNPKASTLGMHRALYYNEQEGHLETFRPYALPGNDWIESVEKNLKRLVAESPSVIRT